MSKLTGKHDRGHIPAKEHPDFNPPVIRAERAEEKIYQEAIEKDEIISRVRTRIGDKK